MAELYSGTEAVSTTEWSLTTDTSGPDADTTDATVQVWLDVSDLVAGDLLALRLYEKVRSGGTQRLVQTWLIAPSGEPIWAGPALMVLHGWDFTLEALSGTVTVEWSIRTVS